MEKGSKHSEETKNKMRLSRLGKIPWNKDKKWPIKHKMKLSEIHKKSKKCQKWLKKLHKRMKGRHVSPATEFKKGYIPWSFKGKTNHTLGYIYLHKPDHPFADVRKKVFEHRLVIEQQIGRYLLLEETGHHLNEIKTDNRPENLMCFSSKSAHIRFHKNPNNVKPSEIIFDGRKLT